MHYTAIAVANQLRITKNAASNVSRSTEVCQDSDAHDHHTPHDSEPLGLLTVPSSCRIVSYGVLHICEVIHLFSSPVLEDGVINFLPAQIRPSVSLILRH